MDFSTWMNDMSVVEKENIERSNYIQFGEPLDVDTIGLYSPKNSQNHKTHKYELTHDKKTPVLRRAQVFHLSLQFRGRNLNLNKDKIVFIFYFGTKANSEDGTKITLTLDPHRQMLSTVKTNWDLVLHKASPKIMILNVQIGSTAPIGAWKFEVETSYLFDKHSPRRIQAANTPLYILFNPYSKDDQVYMPSEAKLEEYIQNPTGKIWKGEPKNLSGRQWIYGQFEEMVLPAVCYIMDTKAPILDTERGDPIKVSRAISSVVNSANNNGIMKGKWSEPYDDGTYPWDWNGSASILEEYIRSNHEVKYGQCWVFSALTVTICRALGIPCRSVTNYTSAHDTNKNLTVEKFFSEEGEELGPKDHPDIGNDSIWNFHVWNDVWMSRPDLSHGYGGWQAIDATPQESSNGLYRCGPSPLLAIKRGEVQFGFDTRFIYSEVNADVCHFVVDPTSSWGFSRTSLKTDEVGKKILTQHPNYMNHQGEDDFEDITHEYKFLEGSTEERLSIFNAIRSTDKAKLHYNITKDQKTDILLKLDGIESVQFGFPYKAKIFLENVSNEPRTLNCLVSSSSMYYTGIKAFQISRAKGIFVLQPGQKETLALTVEPEAYITKLVEYCMIKVYGLIRVEETHQTWSDEIDFVMKKPKLMIQAIGRLHAGQLARLRISFRNPLHLPLTHCKVRIGAAGFFDEIQEEVENVSPHSSFNHVIVVRIKSSGTGSVVATFSSSEMIEVGGSAQIEVN
ncbi:hemocyte protein-glutamine gamma-glutamyltransferase [Lepeophtheirus salmonis]|uniref:hemocyte protein-glutamine gamma-glutamyltransferase n=1 Tax=Lepeophtheirus salmonis TaxID=72036 RepID=UPI001AE3E963|nr:hemocyte protein-glutamine gamma-glutamyltransferase-like [Lepeophtheirus salmonis]